MYENQSKFFILAKAKSKSSSSSLTPDNVKEKSQIGNYFYPFFKWNLIFKYWIVSTPELMKNTEVAEYKSSSRDPKNPFKRKFKTSGYKSAERKKSIHCFLKL